MVHVDLQPMLHDELGRVVSRLRWRLGCERLLVFGIRGAAASGLTLIAFSLGLWLVGGRGSLAWLAIAPLVLALIIGLVHWPGARQAALVADRRLGLDERLATAVELTRGTRSGRFDRLQIADAAARGRAARVTLLALDARTRNEGLLAAGVAVLALASLLLPLLPRPVTSAPAGAPSEVDASAPDEPAQRPLPMEVPVQSAQTHGPPIQPTRPDANLASRVQQEQAEQTALDQLAQAVGTISAGQAAAQDIQQANFSAASDQLQNLGEEADQLSEAAKQQLAAGLQAAAAATAQSDRQLADKEKQAAQALTRSSYVDQRQALRGLADQVQRSGARSVPADQLERDLGQLEQQKGGKPGNNQSAGNGQQAGASPASAANSPANTGQPGAGNGEQGGSGVGTGSNDDLYGAQPEQLDSAGQTVQVPTKLGNGPGVRPADGSEDQTTTSPGIGGRSVSELSQTQQTGQVAPERNLVPGEQRPIVRGYFR